MPVASSVMSKNGIAKKDCSVSVVVAIYLFYVLTAIAVPGKKTIVSKARLFIAELSRLLDAAVV